MNVIGPLSHGGASVIGTVRTMCLMITDVTTNHRLSSQTVCVLPIRPFAVRSSLNRRQIRSVPAIKETLNTFVILQKKNLPSANPLIHLALPYISCALWTTRRQTNSPKFIYGVWTFRHTPKCSGKYESCTSCWVDRFSLERQGGINVLCITSNASQWIGVMYETRSD